MAPDTVEWLVRAVIVIAFPVSIWFAISWPEVQDGIAEQRRAEETP